MSSDATEVWDRGVTGDEEEAGGEWAVSPDPREWGPGRQLGVVVAVVSLGVLLEVTPVADRLAEAGGDLLALAAGYALLIATSGWAVRLVLWSAEVAPKARQARAGGALRRVENVLVFTLALLGAHLAIAIFFAAEATVRSRDAWSGDTPYHLLGSLANLTYSLVLGLLFAELVGRAVF